MACLLPLVAGAQQISYSQPEREDNARNTEFEIIGSVGGNILVFKNNRNDYALSVYDDDMKLEQRVPLDFLPRNMLTVDFVPYADHFQMIYQFQRRDVVYCLGATLGADGSILRRPELIDSSVVGAFQVKNKIYSVIRSGDKSRIMVYKINQNKKYDNVFYTFLLDGDLQLINNSRLTLPMEDKRNFLSSFMLSNDGYFIFSKLVRPTNKGNINAASLVVKPPETDSFLVSKLDLKGQFLDEVKLKLDNINKKVFLASFYYQQRKGNVEGLYAGIYNWAAGSFERASLLPFSDELKANARQQSSLKNAFNDYFIKQLVVRSDGGFLLTAEAYYTSSRSQPWNRWDYLYGGPWGFSPYSSYYYYSPFSPWYYSPYYWDNDRGTRYHYDNVAILSYDGSGKLEWSNFIRKNQYADDNAGQLSYELVNIGSELHFIYNELYRRSWLLTDVAITPEGKLRRMPTLRNLDKGYDWMPRYGKQIGSREVVIPCIYRNYISFAKIDF
ncbi:hypothetical protein GCM10023143_06410 [Compostibacter hankyongensis]|uniref:Uncharacterized protein n=1 Tax=Compostibacter hankyongensis TaxID=1007089 RepID=A0ABP8FGG5_9BACT